MKENIIKIINNRLDNINDNIFKSLIFKDAISGVYKSYIDCNPITISNRYIKSSKDETKDERKDYELLNFYLLFDDGEPNFQIVSDISSTYKSVFTRKLIKKSTLIDRFFSFFYKTFEIETIYDNKITTKIFVDHKEFILNDDERIDLIKRCKVAYEKHMLLKENELNDKINKRLKNI